MVAMKDRFVRGVGERLLAATPWTVERRDAHVRPGVRVRVLDPEWRETPLGVVTEVWEQTQDGETERMARVRLDRIEGEVSFPVSSVAVRL
jgi:hypothetical protein